MTLPPFFNTRYISFSPHAGSGQKYMDSKDTALSNVSSPPPCRMYHPDTADAWHRRIRYCTCPQIFLLLCGCMQRFPPNNRYRPLGFSGNAPKCGQDCRHRRSRRPKHSLRLSAGTPRTPKEREAHALCSLRSLPIYRIYLPVFCNFSRTFLTYSLAPLFLISLAPLFLFFCLTAVFQITLISYA